MSASTIARWKAIPLERAEKPASDAPADDDDDGNTGSRHELAPHLRDLQGDVSSDDNISLVSRSPSPRPHDPMDVATYDEHVRGLTAALEPITVHTRIRSSNRGFALLQKMGWQEGTGLGAANDGRTEPIPFHIKSDSTGLGKAAMDSRIIELTVAQRKDLDSERQVKETAAQRQAREESVAQRQTVAAERASTLRPFYCELCDKQYTTVAQYDEHTNTYAHAHKARARDVQAAERALKAQAGDADRRKERERAREQKELRKIAKAAGVRLPVAAPPPAANAVVAPAIPLAPVDEPDRPVKGFKKSGWATVGATSSGEPPSEGADKPSGFKKSGWAAVGSDQATPASGGFKKSGWASVSTAAASTSPQGGSTSASGWAAVPAEPVGGSAAALSSTSSVADAAAAGGFKRGGWSAAGATDAPAPTPPAPQEQQQPPATDAAPPSSAGFSRSRWAPAPASVPGGAAAIASGATDPAPPDAHRRPRSRSRSRERDQNRSRWDPSRRWDERRRDDRDSYRSSHRR